MMRRGTSQQSTLEFILRKLVQEVVEIHAESTSTLDDQHSLERSANEGQTRQRKPLLNALVTGGALVTHAHIDSPHMVWG